MTDQRTNNKTKYWATTTYRNNVNRIDAQIVDLLKKQAIEKKKEVDLNSKINDLTKMIE